MIINVIKVFDIVYIMTKGGPGGATRVIAYSYYVETFENGLGGYGAAVAMVMLALIIPVMIWQHPAVPQRSGGLVTSTTAAETIAVRPRESTSSRIVAFLGRSPLHIALIVLAGLWLLPTVGLLVTSFRPRPDIGSSGWWTAFTNADFTLKNYDLVMNGTAWAKLSLNSALITVPSTLLPLTIGALAALRVRMDAASRSATRSS